MLKLILKKAERQFSRDSSHSSRTELAGRKKSLSGTDLENVCGIIKREILHKILNEFGVPIKYVRLMKFV
jgi:hypothetical protein